MALAVLAATVAAPAADLDFTLHKKEPAGEGGNTLLIVGGIQGDEPGGFTAASLLVTRYRIRAGRLWVVPNLNFESIIKRSRGVHGDMNRKFLSIATTDPEYEAVQKIKSIILSDEVDMVLNLHDGSGFYRHRRVDGKHGPHRWGQSIVIDQESIGEGPWEHLEGLASIVSASVNAGIEKTEHHYRIKNTRTREGDTEMAKTLTYFAIRNGKPAAGVEASKSLPTHLRTYYHLRVIEAYMRALGIDYERDFELTPVAVRQRIDGDVQLALYENRIFLDVADARKRLRYVPMKLGAPVQFTASNPLVAVIGGGDQFKVRYGNRSVTTLHPQYFEYDDGLDAIEMRVDGRARRVPIGSVVDVHGGFSVVPAEGYRVNAIGFTRSGVTDEAGLEIGRADFAGRFSVDRSGTLFRVEVYRGKRFSGMVLVRFAQRTASPSLSQAHASAGLGG